MGGDVGGYYTYGPQVRVRVQKQSARSRPRPSAPPARTPTLYALLPPAALPVLGDARKPLAVLDAVPGIGMTYFGRADVVRHPLVQAIVQAYEAHEDDDASDSP